VEGKFGGLDMLREGERNWSVNVGKGRRKGEEGDGRPGYVGQEGEGDRAVYEGEKGEEARLFFTMGKRRRRKEKGERRKEKGERRQEKGIRRQEKGERRKEKGERNGMIIT
jgi:hypothetical protein